MTAAASAPPPRIYVLPTRFGAAFAVMGLLTLIGCVNYLLSLGYAVAFLMLSIWIMSAAHASHALTGVALGLKPPDRAHAGGLASYTVTLHNSRAEPRPGVRVRSGQAELRLNLEAGGQQSGVLGLPMTARGPFVMPDLRIEAHDPLGLWRSWGDVPQGVLTTAELLVAPDPEPQPPTPERGVEHAQGQRRRAATGQDDLSGLRPYRDGDPLRSVAWRHAARTGDLLTREYDSPTAQVVQLDWDATRTLLHTEQRLSRLTAWVLEAERQGLRFGLRLPGQRLEPGAGESQLRRALALLAVHDLPVPGPVRSRRWRRP
ncbi:DUF58 domain-containing protein [Deinococcus sonorensis]|uniref:DUF58 domain-containing protein n=2 Tax=Deinococcus sonorensis TaxID=309891 RepID=A0AAU7UAB3_9DEIO